MYSVILYLKNPKCQLKSYLQHINVWWFLLFIMYDGNICFLYPAVFESSVMWR